MSCGFREPLLAPTWGGDWTLSASALTYHVTHPLHKVQGVSKAAKGKGDCDAKGCGFLVAVPVKTFESGDGNRDSHMWQVAKAGTYPLVQVRITGIAVVGKGDPKEMRVDATVEFAGKKVEYPKVLLEVVSWGSSEVRLKGTLPLTLKAFEISAPSLLGMAVSDEIPVGMDLTWIKGR